MDDDQPLTAEELKELGRTLAMMSEASVKEFYRAAYERCRFVENVPKPSDVQHLVAAWKQLWKWR